MKQWYHVAFALACYYPFGMLQNNRNYNAGKYRYGFNGKENDNEVNGDGNQQDYGMRIYNAQIGRFLSMDPLQKRFPELTPYQYASNTPIQAIDLDGLEAVLLNEIKSHYRPRTPLGYMANDVARSVVGKTASGTSNGVLTSLKNTWNFFKPNRGSAYKVETWKNAGKFFEELAFSTSTVKVYNTPMVDAKVDEFANKVIKGNAYSRSEYISEFATNMATGYLADKGLGELSGLKLSATLPEGTQIAGFSFSRGASKLIKKVNEFTLGHSEEAILKSSDYNAIKNLSDKDLVESVLHPKNNENVAVNTQTGVLSNGNTRIYELQRRKINIDVPYNEYNPDRSMFPELKEPLKKK